LKVLLPQPEIDYGYIGPGHMFPRSDGILLGGTFDRNEWSLEVNPEQSNSILNTHRDHERGEIGLARLGPMGIHKPYNSGVKK
jgi:hypothetical protein